MAEHDRLDHDNQQLFTRFLALGLGRQVTPEQFLRPTALTEPTITASVIPDSPWWRQLPNQLQPDEKDWALDNQKFLARRLQVIRSEEERPNYSGRRLGDYQLQECLGGGESGSVHRARHQILQADRVLKILRSDYDAARRRLYVREARIAASLDHSNILRTFDIQEGSLDGDCSKLTYIVMEYFPSVPLSLRKKLFRTSDHFHPQRASEIALAIASALDYMHRQGIIHGDLSSGNVLEGTDSRIKISDFGLAKQRDGTEVVGDKKKATIYYAASEVLDGEPPTEESDAYSLGALIFELLTNHTVSEGSYPRVIHDTLYKEAPPPSLYWPGYKGKMDELFRKQLSKDPSDRLLPITFAKNLQEICHLIRYR